MNTGLILGKCKECDYILGEDLIKVPKVLIRNTFAKNTSLVYIT